MILIVLLGFSFVIIADTLYLKYAHNDPKTTTRRKIFHFVPITILPLLSNYNYKLFTLMVFGSFYLFWVLEIGRYYGKFAK
jgi:hypothetical protein